MSYSGITRKRCINHGHRLLFLPAYSPDLNPIEQQWAIIKNKAKKIVSGFDSLYSCREAVFKTI